MFSFGMAGLVLLAGIAVDRLARPTPGTGEVTPVFDADGKPVGWRQP